MDSNEEKQPLKTEADLVIENRTEFFITELARMDEEYTRAYTSLARRLTIVEQKGKVNDDPTAMISSVIFALMILQVAPIVIDLIRQWRESSRSSE